MAEPTKLAALHQTVADELRKRIIAGSFGTGAKLPPLREIADEFDVSTMTVRGAIRALEIERLIYRIPRVGAFVREPEGAGTAHDLVAFIGGDLSSSFQASVVRGVQGACQKSGAALQLLDAHFDAHTEHQNILRLPHMGVKGALVLPPFSDPNTTRMLVEVCSPHFPLVFIDQLVSGISGDMVASDHEDGAYQATKHLVARGHTQILMLTHPPEGSTSVMARIHGYDRVLWSTGQTPLNDSKVWINDEDQLAGYRLGKKWWAACQTILPVLRKATFPLAVLSIDAYTAWGVYEACQELGLSIPEDVSVIGFDDLEFTHTIKPPMTIISQRVETIGQKAFEILQERLTTYRQDEEEFTVTQQVVVPVDLIERESIARITGVR